MIPNTSNNLKRIEYTDLKMESRYLTMHKLNQDYQKERNIVLQNENSQLQLDEVSTTSFPTKDTGTYLSLACLNSLEVAKLPSTENEFLSARQKHDTGSMNIDILSDISVRSYSENPIGAILTPKLCSIRPRSKSYEIVSLSFSNPSYMKDIEKNILEQPESSE